MIHAVHPLSTIPLCHLAYAPILHTNSPVSSPYISLQISWENFEKLMIKAFLLRWSCHSHNLFSLNVSHGPTYMQKLQKKKSFFSSFLNSNKATFLQMGQWTCSSLRVELRMQDNILGTQRYGRKNSELQITRNFYNILKDSCFSIPKHLHKFFVKCSLAFLYSSVFYNIIICPWCGPLYLSMMHKNPLQHVH